MLVALSARALGAAPLARWLPRALVALAAAPLARRPPWASAAATPRALAAEGRLILTEQATSVRVPVGMYTGGVENGMDEGEEEL